MATSSVADLWETLADEAAAESRLWGDSLRAPADRETEPVFSCLCDPAYALGVETIYEGYLLHYGRPRLFAPADSDTALLLGDYLYAHGLVRVAATGSVKAVHDLAELISLCGQARAEGRAGEAEAWAATAALLGQDALEEARAALRSRADATPLRMLAAAAVGPERLERACGAHRRRVG